MFGGSLQIDLIGSRSTKAYELKAWSFLEDFVEYKIGFHDKDIYTLSMEPLSQFLGLPNSSRLCPAFIRNV